MSLSFPLHDQKLTTGEAAWGAPGDCHIHPPSHLSILGNSFILGWFEKVLCMYTPFFQAHGTHQLV